MAQSDGPVTPPPHGSSAFTCVVVLDFDNTLSVSETHGSSLADVIGRVFGGAERLSMLSAWVGDLHDRGVLLTVVSRNVRPLVRECISKAGWTHLFGPHVYTAEDVEMNSMLHARKSETIRKRILDPLGVLHEDVIFVDDSQKDCTDVQTRLPRVQTYRVQGRKGLSVEDCANITAWIDGQISKRASMPPYIMRMPTSNAIFQFAPVRLRKALNFSRTTSTSSAESSVSSRTGSASDSSMSGKLRRAASTRSHTPSAPLVGMAGKDDAASQPGLRRAATASTR